MSEPTDTSELRCALCGQRACGWVGTVAVCVRHLWIYGRLGR